MGYSRSAPILVRPRLKLTGLVLFPFCAAFLAECPDKVDKVAWNQGAKWARPAANDIPGVRSETPAPGGARSEWEQGAEREQGV